MPVLGALLASGVPADVALRLEVVALATAPAASGSVVAGTRPATGDGWTGMVVIAWALVAGGGMVRLAAGVRTLCAWRTRCRPLPDGALDHLPIWRRLRTTGRRARVAWSPDVESPCVLGLWAPIIALPRAAEGLPQATLDAVLVHEYAHVQRRDDLTQFLQHLLRAACIGHPAVWWIDRHLAVEREAACDDWVLALAASPRAYAGCLLSLAERRAAIAGPHVAMQGGRSQLAARVRRIVHAHRHRRLQAGPAVLTAVPTCVAIALVGLMAWHAPILQVALPAARPHVPAVAAHVLRTTSMAPPVVHPSREAVASSRAHDVTPPLAAPTATAPTTPAAMWGNAAGIVPSVLSLMVPLAPALQAGHVPSMARSSPPSGGASAITATPTRLAQVGTAFRATGTTIGDAGVSVAATVAGSSRDTANGLTRGGVATGSFFSRLGRRIARSF